MLFYLNELFMEIYKWHTNNVRSSTNNVAYQYCNANIAQQIRLVKVQLLSNCELLAIKQQFYIQILNCFCARLRAQKLEDCFNLNGILKQEKHLYPLMMQK